MTNGLHRRLDLLEKKVAPDLVWTNVIIPKNATVAEKVQLTSEAIANAQSENVGREIGVVQHILV